MSLEETELDESGGEEDEGEIIDWQLPLCFMKKRHRERIEGAEPLASTWRMKERVCDINLPASTGTSALICSYVEFCKWFVDVTLVLGRHCYRMALKITN